LAVHPENFRNNLARFIEKRHPQPTGPTLGVLTGRHVHLDMKIRKRFKGMFERLLGQCDAPVLKAFREDDLAIRNKLPRGGSMAPAVKRGRELFEVNDAARRCLRGRMGSGRRR